MKAAVGEGFCAVMRTDLTPDLIDYLGAMARRLCGTPETAQDLAQEALLRLWALEEAPDNPRAYAVVVLRNLYRQGLRDRVETVQIEGDLPGAAEGPGAALALAELEAALARLPRNQARLMRLVAVAETSPAELARIR